jgi:hypothetical protein
MRKRSLLLRLFVGFLLGLVVLVLLAAVLVRQAFQPEQGAFIDRTGREVPAPVKDLGKAYADGVLRAFKERGVSPEPIREFVDEDGSFVVHGARCQTHEPGPWRFDEGLSLVMIGESACYFDKAGELTVEVAGPVASAQGFSEGLAAVAVPGDAPPQGGWASPKWGFVDKSGTFVIRPAFEHVSLFSEELAAVARDGVYGYIDKAGAFVIAPSFDAAGPFSEGLAAVRTGGEWGYIDKTGVFPMEQRFSQAGNFSEGLAAVTQAISDAGQTEWLRGYIDSTGSFAIPAQFGGAEPFSDGLAAVLVGNHVSGQWGYVDRTGAFAIEPAYAWAESFTDGLALVHRPVPLKALATRIFFMF